MTPQVMITEPSPVLAPGAFAGAAPALNEPAPPQPARTLPVGLSSQLPRE